MIQLKFIHNRDVINFTVKDREIWYSDRIFNRLIRCLPPANNFLTEIRNSRNKIPPFIGKLFTFTDEEIKEYEAQKTEEDLARVIIRDALFKGLKLLDVKDEKGNNIQLTKSEETK
jgi:hypothetical protein